MNPPSHLHDLAPAQRRTQQKLLVVVLLVLVVLVNAVAALAVQRFSLKLDLTEANVYRLSPASLGALQRLDTPVRITVFGKEQDYPVILREILALYSGASSLVSITYRDPSSNPVLLDSYMDRGTRIGLNDLVVEAADSFRRHALQDLYTLDSSNARITSVRVEQQVTSAIVQLQSTRRPVAWFADGHDERPSKALMDLFARNNYQVGRSALAVERLHEGVDVLVVASPRRDYTPPEIADIDAFLGRGGSLMVFLAPSANPLPQLEALLARWGIRVGNALVFEPRAHVSDNPTHIIPMYAPHPINAYFGGKRAYLLSPASRVLGVTDSTSFDLEVLTVLSSTPDAYAKAGTGFGSLQRAPGDLPGPFDLALTTTRAPAAAPRGAASTAAPATRGGRIFAAGSEAVYADDVMGMSNFANAEFMTQVIQWLHPAQVALQIAPKKIAPDVLAMPTGDAMAFGALLTGLVPLSFLLAGLVVALRRRRMQ